MVDGAGEPLDGNAITPRAEGPAATAPPPPALAQAGALDRFFQIGARGSTLRRELTAGLTTFLAMSYILFVNPQILSEAGMDPGAVFVATCLATAAGTLIMGLYANFPIAVAPGMGLNAFFTYGVVIGMGVPWQVALGAVFLSGVTFLALSLLPIREWIINAIPHDLKLAISAGIGLFLLIIGLTNVGLVVDSPATLVTMGSLTSTPVVLAIVGFLLIALLEARRVPGAILIGILVTALLGVALGLAQFGGIASAPPSVAPTLLALDVESAFTLALVGVIISLLFVDMFDTAGTLIAVAHKAGLLDEDGKLPGMRRALVADSTATIIGAAIGTSSVTSYVESAAGVRAGGRTGLTAVVVAGLFLLALLLSPLAGMIQSYATGPALIFVGCVMVSGLAEIDWEDATSFVPAVITAVGMPFTYSIATGLGLGFIAYAVLKVGTGKAREAGVGVLVLAALFLLKFAFIDGAA